MINKNKYQIINHKPLLHKKGKKWIVIGISALALVGLGVPMTNISANSINTNSINTQKNTTNQNITKKSSDLYKQIIKNNAGTIQPNSMSQKSSESKASQDNSVSSSSTSPSFNSAYNSYMAKMSNTDSIVSEMNDSKNTSSISHNTKLLSTTNESANNYCGLNYKYDLHNKAVEFINGTAQPNLSDFITKAPDDIRTATSIKFDSDIDTTHVNNMAEMFENDEDLESLDLGNNFNTSYVTNMFDMFFNIPRLKELNLGNKFNTSSVINMFGMFNTDPLLQSLDLGNNFDTHKVITMEAMFKNDRNLSYLNLGDKFDTSNVTDMNSMFNSDSSLSHLNLGNKFNTYNVTDMFNMFYNMSKLQNLNLGPNFDTSNVTSMWGMFGNDSSLAALNLGTRFNTNNVTETNGMFDGDIHLFSLTLPYDFNTKKITNMGNMFLNTGLHIFNNGSTDAIFNSSAGLPTNLYTQLPNGQKIGPVNLNNNINDKGYYAPSDIRFPMTNPNEKASKLMPQDNPISDTFQQNYHFNNPMGQSNDIEAINPHFDKNGKISYWDIYYLWNTIPLKTDKNGNNMSWIPTDQWGHAITKDGFKSFTPVDSHQPLSINNVVIPDPEYTVYGKDRVEIEPYNQNVDYPWGQVAGGSVFSNKKANGTSWISSDIWGNKISPKAQLAIFATYRSHAMSNGETEGNYLAYANPNNNGGYQQFRPTSYNDVFDSTTLGESINKDGRDPFITVNPKNNNQLIAYLAGGITHKVFTLVSSDAINWHEASTIDLTNIMNKFEFSNPMSVETPHINIISGQPILTFSAQDSSNPQNEKAEEKQGMLYVSGHFDNNGLFQLDQNSKSGFIDGGFDNYAGDFANLDANHLIYIGWLGNWYTGDGYHNSGFSVPKVFTWNGDNLEATPVNPGALVNSDTVKDTHNQYQPNGIVNVQLNTPSRWKLILNRSDKTSSINSPITLVASFNDGKLTISRSGSACGEANMSSTINLGKDLNKKINQISKVSLYLDNESLGIYLPETHQVFTMLNLTYNKNTPYILTAPSNSIIKSYQFGDKLTFMDGSKVITSDVNSQQKGSVYHISNNLVPKGYHLNNDDPRVFTTDNSNHVIQVSPNQNSITVNYQYNGKTLSSQEFTGNDSNATQVGNTSINVTSQKASAIPKGYSLANTNNVFNYDGNNHNVAIVPNIIKGYANIHLIYGDSDGDIINSDDKQIPVSSKVGSDVIISPNQFSKDNYKTPTNKLIMPITVSDAPYSNNLNYHINDTFIYTTKAPTLEHTIVVNYIDKTKNNVIKSDLPITKESGATFNINNYTKPSDIPSGYSYISTSNAVSTFDNQNHIINILLSKSSASSANSNSSKAKNNQNNGSRSTAPSSANHSNNSAAIKPSGSSISSKGSKASSASSSTSKVPSSNTSRASSSVKPTSGSSAKPNSNSSVKSAPSNSSATAKPSSNNSAKPSSTSSNSSSTQNKASSNSKSASPSSNSAKSGSAVAPSAKSTGSAKNSNNSSATISNSVNKSNNSSKNSSTNSTSTKSNNSSSAQPIVLPSSSSASSEASSSASATPSSSSTSTASGSEPSNSNPTPAPQSTSSMTSPSSESSKQKQHESGKTESAKMIPMNYQHNSNKSKNDDSCITKHNTKATSSETKNKPNYAKHNLAHSNRINNSKVTKKHNTKNDTHTSHKDTKKLPQTSESKSHAGIFGFIMLMLTSLLTGLGRHTDKKHKDNK